MLLVSWNVNGLRACLKKGFIEAVRIMDPDMLCLQETKMEKGQAEVDLPDYEEYFYSAEKRGYSGTALFARRSPLSVRYGIGMPEHDREGRVITAEYRDFYLVNVYTPNSRAELVRLDYRMVWEDAFREYVLGLDAQKPVVICGDLNVAHKEIDLKNPKPNMGNAGFTIQERDKLSCLLEAGFADTYRQTHPGLSGAYTWWSWRANARANNTGWRIDYFLVSKRLMPAVVSADIYPEVEGSDHCPVALRLEL